MRVPKFNLLTVLILLLAINYTKAQCKNRLTIRGTCFELNGNPFEYTGISIFNAISNSEFNKNCDERRAWIQKFKNSGINVFRVWCQ